MRETDTDDHPHNICALNGRLFTFDIVVWTKWKFVCERGTWSILVVGPLQHTYRLRLGRVSFTFWWKRR